MHALTGALPLSLPVWWRPGAYTPEPDRRELSAAHSRKVPEAIRMFVPWSLHRQAPSFQNGHRLRRTELAAVGLLGGEPVTAQAPSGGRS
jgi:hypothetical protein